MVEKRDINHTPTGVGTEVLTCTLESDRLVSIGKTTRFKTYLLPVYWYGPVTPSNRS